MKSCSASNFFHPFLDNPMNRFTKIVLLIVFHGLMMVDFHYWKLAKEHILLAIKMASSDAIITPIAALVVWLCFGLRKK